MVPKWMKLRVLQVEYLRGRGVDSALIAHSTERQVTEMYVKEKAKEAAIQRDQA